MVVSWFIPLNLDQKVNLITLKARLVARGYNHIKGHNYGDTLSPMQKMTIVHHLLPWFGLPLTSSSYGY